MAAMADNRLNEALTAARQFLSENKDDPSAPALSRTLRKHCETLIEAFEPYNKLMLVIQHGYEMVKPARLVDGSDDVVDPDAGVRIETPQALARAIYELDYSLASDYESAIAVADRAAKTARLEALSVAVTGESAVAFVGDSLLTVFSSADPLGPNVQLDASSRRGWYRQTLGNALEQMQKATGNPTVMPTRSLQTLWERIGHDALKNHGTLTEGWAALGRSAGAAGTEVGNQLRAYIDSVTRGDGGGGGAATVGGNVGVLAIVEDLVHQNAALRGAVLVTHDHANAVDVTLAGLVRDLFKRELVGALDTSFIGNLFPDGVEYKRGNPALGRLTDDQRRIVGAAVDASILALWASANSDDATAIRNGLRRTFIDRKLGPRATEVKEDDALFSVATLEFLKWYSNTPSVPGRTVALKPELPRSRLRVILTAWALEGLKTFNLPPPPPASAPPADDNKDGTWADYTFGQWLNDMRASDSMGKSMLSVVDQMTTVQQGVAWPTVDDCRDVYGGLYDQWITARAGAAAGGDADVEADRNAATQIRNAWSDEKKGERIADGTLARLPALLGTLSSARTFFTEANEAAWREYINMIGETTLAGDTDWRSAALRAYVFARTSADQPSDGDAADAAARRRWPFLGDTVRGRNADPDRQLATVMVIPATIRAALSTRTPTDLRTAIDAAKLERVGWFQTSVDISKQFSRHLVAFTSHVGRLRLSQKLLSKQTATFGQAAFAIRNAQTILSKLRSFASAAVSAHVRAIMTSPEAPAPAAGGAAAAAAAAAAGVLARGSEEAQLVSSLNTKTIAVSNLMVALQSDATTPAALSTLFSASCAAVITGALMNTEDAVETLRGFLLGGAATLEAIGDPTVEFDVAASTYAFPWARDLAARLDNSGSKTATTDILTRLKSVSDGVNNMARAISASATGTRDAALMARIANAAIHDASALRAYLSKGIRSVAASEFTRTQLTAALTRTASLLGREADQFNELRKRIDTERETERKFHVVLQVASTYANELDLFIQTRWRDALSMQASGVADAVDAKIGVPDAALPAADFGVRLDTIMGAVQLQRASWSTEVVRVIDTYIASRNADHAAAVNQYTTDVTEYSQRTHALNRALETVRGALAAGDKNRAVNAALLRWGAHFQHIVQQFTNTGVVATTNLRDNLQLALDGRWATMQDFFHYDQIATAAELRTTAELRPQRIAGATVMAHLLTLVDMHIGQVARVIDAARGGGGDACTDYLLNSITQPPDRPTPVDPAEVARIPLVAVADPSRDTVTNAAHNHNPGGAVGVAMLDMVHVLGERIHAIVALALRLMSHWTWGESIATENGRRVTLPKFGNNIDTPADFNDAPDATLRGRGSVRATADTHPNTVMLWATFDDGRWHGVDIGAEAKSPVDAIDEYNRDSRALWSLFCTLVLQTNPMERELPPRHDPTHNADAWFRAPGGIRPEVVVRAVKGTDTMQDWFRRRLVWFAGLMTFGIDGAGLVRAAPAGGGGGGPMHYPALTGLDASLIVAHPPRYAAADIEIQRAMAVARTRVAWPDPRAVADAASAAHWSAHIVDARRWWLRILRAHLVGAEGMEHEELARVETVTRYAVAVSTELENIRAEAIERARRVYTDLDTQRERTEAFMRWIGDQAFQLLSRVTSAPRIREQIERAVPSMFANGRALLRVTPDGRLFAFDNPDLEAKWEAHRRGDPLGANDAEILATRERLKAAYEAMPTLGELFQSVANNLDADWARLVTYTRANWPVVRPDDAARRVADANLQLERVQTNLALAQSREQRDRDQMVDLRAVSAAFATVRDLMREYNVAEAKAGPRAAAESPGAVVALLRQFIRLQGERMAAGGGGAAAAAAAARRGLALNEGLFRRALHIEPNSKLDKFAHWLVLVQGKAALQSVRQIIGESMLDPATGTVLVGRDQDVVDALASLEDAQQGVIDNLHASELAEQARVAALGAAAARGAGDPDAAARAEGVENVRRALDRINVATRTIRQATRVAADAFAERLGRMNAVIGRRGATMRDLWPYMRYLLSSALYAHVCDVVALLGTEKDLMAPIVRAARNAGREPGADVLDTVLEDDELLRTSADVLAATLRRTLVETSGVDTMSGDAGANALGSMSGGGAMMVSNLKAATSPTTAPDMLRAQLANIDYRAQIAIAAFQRACKRVATSGGMGVGAVAAGGGGGGVGRWDLL